MKLYNRLTRTIDEVKPLDNSGKTVRIYSCGPTVYDHAHIGNLSAYVFADTLRRAITIAGYDVRHAMNYTDVDDKTINRSQTEGDGNSPREKLQNLTDTYIGIFNKDMAQIGNKIDELQLIRATDQKVIEGMQALITELVEADIAYLADDGVYFSIDAYKKTGKVYGQLLKLSTQDTDHAQARIQNDEYDKESVHDFALWKKQKAGEPAWEFEIDGQDLSGRPGWHIECSVMSRQELGQPFDIHTGGIDLIFPHHENEIAQSTALEASPVMAQIFAHNEHILVDGKKMAKSAKNFYTLRDVTEKGFDPLAFRLLILQGHYRNQIHFSWENLEAAQNRLQELRAWADLRWQGTADVFPQELDELYRDTRAGIKAALVNDLNTPEAFAALSKLVNFMSDIKIPDVEGKDTDGMLAFLDQAFGLGLADRPDINDEQKQLMAQRQAARDAKDWAKSDELRDQLKAQGIGVRDTPHGSIWSRLNN